jgi:hypothetical protein
LGDASSGSTTTSQALNQQELFDEISRTLPLEIELLRPQHYKVELRHGTFDFIVLKLFIPSYKERALAAWQESFEAKHGVKLFVQRERVYYGLKNQLAKLADGQGLLGAEQSPVITRILDHFNGSSPTAANLTEPVRLPTKICDRTVPHFITIDAAETKCREDAVCAQLCVDGDVRLSVAITDITWLVTPGSYVDYYAQKLGASIFGSRRVISTIGTDLAFNLASFSLGEERCAWIFDFRVRPDGTSEAVAPPYRARIVVKEHFTPAQINAGCAEENGRGEVLRLVMEACLRMHRARIRARKMMRVKGEGVAELAVAESMIAAKHSVARFISAQASVPAIFKVHTAPPLQEKESLVAQANQLGVLMAKGDFDDPLLLAQALSALARKGSQEDPRNAAAGMAANLSDRLLGLFLSRSRYDIQNLGHHGLGLDAYMDIKPRDASGIANQFQLRAICEGAPCPLGKEDVESRVKARNRKLMRYDRVAFRLRFLEMLERKLAWAGNKYPALVIEEKADHVLIDVPGFSKWGILRRNSRSLSPGDRVVAQLDGFSVHSMRFCFSHAEGDELSQ